MGTNRTLAALRAAVLTWIATGLAACASHAVPAASAHWVTTWAATPLPPHPAMGPFPATPSFSNQTIRQVLRVSAGGDRVRIRLTNEYGTQPLRIGAARVALADASGAVRAGTEHVLLFGGKPAVIIPASSPFVSDPVDLPVHALETLSISLFLPDDTGPCTCHDVGTQTAFISANGDFTARAFTPERTLPSRAFVSEVEVQATDASTAIVILGDSISDGVGSTPDANHRWPDLLAERLSQRDRDVGWGVVNEGISGNRVLEEGVGPSALARFDRDVLAIPGVRYVIIFEGVNDLGFAFGHPPGPLGDVIRSMAPKTMPTAESMIAGYRQLIDRAHANGLMVFGATLAPYGGAAYYAEEGNSVREAINRWIRTSGAFDAVLDFDAVLRDPDHPNQLAPALHMGDHLHGNDAGYRAIASSIDLSLFKMP